MSGTAHLWLAKVPSSWEQSWAMFQQKDAWQTSVQGEVCHGNSSPKHHKTRGCSGPVRNELWWRWHLSHLNAKDQQFAVKEMDKRWCNPCAIHGNSVWKKKEIFWGHKLQPLLASWLLKSTSSQSVQPLLASGLLKSISSPSWRTYHKGSGPQIRSKMPPKTSPTSENLMSMSMLEAWCIIYTPENRRLDPSKKWCFDVLMVFVSQ